MKSFNIPLPKHIRFLSFFILLLIGFACTTDTEEDLLAPGQSQDSVEPSTTYYMINGKVVGERDDTTGIADILIEIKVDMPHFPIDTVFTGKDGKFSWKEPVSTFDKGALFTIAATDTTGRYLYNSTTVSFEKSEAESSDTWFLGEAQKEVIMKLTEKTD